MLPELIIKAHRIAAFLAASTPENAPFFADFCDIFQQCDFYKQMTADQSKEAQADLQARMEFVKDIKLSNDFVLANILQEVLLNLSNLNAALAAKEI